MKYRYHFLFVLVILLSFSTEIFAQEGSTITGIVTDSETTEPLPGVNIAVKGTTTGTSTDSEGSYSLTVPALNDTLVFSFIGYQTQEIPINGREAINITLESDIISGEEVLVVGYGGQQSKVTATGAGSSVSGASIKEIPSPNVSQSLGGKVPGLTMINTSGQPGSDEATLRIRGEHTLNNNAPLIVIDGVPNRSGGLSRLNPDDIENITVLKDATAAIYGAQAGNGVILVETKRGREGPPQLSIEYNQGIAMPSRMPEMADAATYLTMLNEVAEYRGNDHPYPDEEIQKYRNIDQQDPWLYRDTNWAEEAIQNSALRSKTNVSVVGGSESMTYRVSFGTKTENGVLVDTENKYNQYNFRSNLDGDITNNISLRVDVAGRWEDRNYAPMSGKYSDVSAFGKIYQSKPHLPAFWPNGQPGPAIEEGENPVIMGSSVTGLEERDRYFLQTNAQLEIDIPNIEGLKLRTTGAFDLTTRRIKSWNTPWTLYNFDEDAYREQRGDPEQYLYGGKRGPDTPTLNEESNVTSDILLNLVGEYQRGLNDHSFSAIVGTEYQRNEHSYFAAFRRGFISNLIPEFFAGAEENQNIRGSANHGVRLNFFGRANYDFKNKYLFEFIGRYDGSFIFPAGKRFGFFPAFSAGWRISEEDFFQNNVSFFDELKIRASWGQTGNDRVDPYQFLRTFRYGRGYYFNPDQKEQSIEPAETPNPDITWEVANQLDIGIEGAIFNDRLSFELDYFKYLRTNILTYRNASVPQTAGLELPRENIGEVASWGYDGSISWQQILSDDFLYDVTLTGGYATNEIRFWDEPPGAPEWQRSTGSKMNTALRYETIGVFNDQEEVDSYPHWPGARPGDLIFKDVNEDGEITADDRVRAERNSIPEWTGGLTFSTSYKQFQATVFFQGATGASEYVDAGGGDFSNYYAQFAERRWTPDNPNAIGPRAYNGNEEYWQDNGNTYFWRKTDYIRLKQVELAYNIQPSVLSKIGLTNAKVYVNGFNLATWTNFIGDPGTANENSSYPQLKVFNLGVSITL